MTRGLESESAAQQEELHAIKLDNSRAGQREASAEAAAVDAPGVQACGIDGVPQQGWGARPGNETEPPQNKPVAGDEAAAQLHVHAPAPSEVATAEPVAESCEVLPLHPAGTF